MEKDRPEPGEIEASHVRRPVVIVRAVTTVRPKARSTEVTPLAAGEAARADQMAQRLHAELSRLMRQIPESSRGASSLSRLTGVLRVTCQRVVSALADLPVGPRLLVRLPGTEGLRQFLDGMATAGAAKEDIGTAQAAVDEFERLLSQLGGGQARLAERLAAGGGSVQVVGEDSVAVRRSLNDAAWRVTGRRCETSLSIYAFRVPEQSPGTLERALAKGVIGVQLAEGGLPLQLSSGDTLAEDDGALAGRAGDGVSTLDASLARGRTPEAILGPFTSHPMPTVTARGGKGSLMQVVDPSERTREPFDVVTAVRANSPVHDPATGKPSLHEVWSLVNMPSRRLVLDVYLHRGIERRYRPSIDAQLWNPGLTVPEEQRWATRLSPQPRLQLLGSGLGQAACESYARHAELTAYFFQRLAWPVEEFVGFRCEVVQPIWRAGYCMSFEHVGDGQSPRDPGDTAGAEDEFP